MRRNFTQLAQKHANPQQTNLLTGHSESSTVQWKNYASTYEKLDVVKLLLEDTYEEDIEMNEYVTGQRSLAKYSERRLDKQEYTTLILPQIATEKRNLDEFTEKLKSKYEAYSSKDWDKLTLPEQSKYIDLRKVLLNKRVAAVTKAEYDKLKKLHDGKLRELTVNNGGKSLESKYQSPYYNEVLLLLICLLPKCKHPLPLAMKVCGTSLI
jgi:hypothetical protein